jgi:pimeloyl-ACP methyl ester carboxylesterase
MSVGRRLGVAAAALGAVTGLVVAAERTAAKRLRAREHAETDESVVVEFERNWRLPAHDGGELFVVEAGSGPPILLSHGVTLSVRVWTKQLRSLAAAGFRVIAYDHRGHGDSPIGPAGHGLEQIAADLGSVIEAMDLRDVVVVGHSMGGIATEVFCLDHPDVAHERVAGIVLLSTLARSPFAANPRLAQLLTGLADRLPDTAGALRARDLGLLIARLGFGRSPAPAHVEATRQMILATDPRTRREATTALAGLDVTGRLATLDLPTLVVCGTADLVTPLAESRRIARRIPGARLEVLAGGGHMLMFEQPETLDRLIVDFARSVQGRAQPAGDPAADAGT